MKIGILTQPLGTNYGGILQAYALQTILKDMGHEAIILDRLFPKIPLYRKIVGTVKRIFLKFLLGRNIKVIPYYLRKNRLDIVYSNLDKFISLKITKTCRIESYAELVEIASSYNFDAYIVGSDQVWRPKYSPMITNYFCDFINSSSNSICISYAASFGVDNWEFSKEDTVKCKDLIKKFKAVSVREDSGINLCNKYLDVEAQKVLDPTMLISKEEYLKMIPNSFRDDFLFYYILDETKIKMEILSKIASHYSLSAKRILPENRVEQDNYSNIEECIYPDLTCWIENVANAKVVFTDSFHGCVFAIIFNKPFYVVVNSERGASRFNSLLKMFSLENRIINNLDDITPKLLSVQIDWVKVNTLLEVYKTDSLKYLSRNLNTEDGKS